MHVSGNTLYISGTHPNPHNRTSDYVTDVSIPLRALRHTWRFEQAATALRTHPSVDTLVGHSLGGAIAQELSTHASIKRARVYGAPTLFGRPKVVYYRHPGDPVSVSNRIGQLFGRASRNTPSLGNPHSYSGF